MKKRKKRKAAAAITAAVIILSGTFLFKGYGAKETRDFSEYVKANPELKTFAEEYEDKKDMEFEIDLSDLDRSHVPLLLQWDERWGYGEYSGDLFGLSGCGPTCLSMVSIYLLDDCKYDPAYIGRFSEENGYSHRGGGSSWTLISEGGPELGLSVKELPLMKSAITESLKEGKPVICVMGPGDFTSKGHFIVMTDYIDGMIKINDPNSVKRSEKLWRYEDIEGQIKNLWSCGV